MNIASCRKKSNKVSQRSKSATTVKYAPVLLTSKVSCVIEEASHESQEPSVKQDRKHAKSAKARLEKTPKAPKPRNPRDHPMVKMVGRTRALIGQAKKAQSSTVYVDPEKSQRGTIVEKQIKKKAAKLAKRRDAQVLENVTTYDKVEGYLNSYPLVHESKEEIDTLANYGLVRNTLIERNISLVSALDRENADTTGG